MPSGNLCKPDNRLHVKFIGGAPCLDFVNTVSGRDRAGTVIREKIANYADLAAWSVLAGILRPAEARALARAAARDAAQAAAVLQRARALREALYRIFQHSIARRRPSDPDLEILAQSVAAARARQRLTLRAAGFVWEFAQPAADLERPIWPVAISAASLLTSPDLPRVKPCAGEDCRWLFLDVSRNGRRQWCDMRDCGNRAKVRRFRLAHGE